MFESSNFLCLRQVSSHGFLQINKYMENLEFHFSFFFLWEYYLYLNKCHHPVIESFCLSLLPWVKFSWKRPPFLRPLSLPVGSEAHAVLRALTRSEHFYGSRGWSLVGQDFLDFLPLLRWTLQSSRTSGLVDLGSDISELKHHLLPAVSWVGRGGAWQLRAMSGMCKFHHGFYNVPMIVVTAMETVFFLREGLGSQCSSLFLSA